MDLVKHCDVTDLDRLDVLLLPCNHVHRVPSAFKSVNYNALPIDDNLPHYRRFSDNLSSLRLSLNFSWNSYIILLSLLLYRCWSFIVLKLGINQKCALISYIDPSFPEPISSSRTSNLRRTVTRASTKTR